MWKLRSCIFFAGSAFDIFALYSCRAPEDEHRNVTVADVWTLEGEHLPNYMVRAGLLLQVEDVCGSVAMTRWKGRSMQSRNICIYIYIYLLKEVAEGTVEWKDDDVGGEEKLASLVWARDFGARDFGESNRGCSGKRQKQRPSRLKHPGVDWMHKLLNLCLRWAMVWWHSSWGGPSTA